MSLRDAKNEKEPFQIDFDFEIPMITSLDDFLPNNNFGLFDFGNKYKLNRMDLYNDHLYLIEQCVATKRHDIISQEDLEKEAKVALLDAALNFNDHYNFKQTALSKMERALNVAIAEKYFLNNLTEDTNTYMNIYCEMQSIYYRFSTLYV